jgi:hypothetical protein
MGIESLLFSSIFFEPGADIPMYGSSEMIERGRLYEKANDVGTSDYQTFLTDPQPVPDLITTVPEFVKAHTQVIKFGHDNANYFNGSGKLMGGITPLNHSEMMSLFRKHNK